jgi:hypothetical protein
LRTEESGPDGALRGAKLVLAESEVSAVALEGGALRVRFAAARVAGGWLNGLELVVEAATGANTIAGTPGRVVEARAIVDGRVPALAIPSRTIGDVTLSLRFANGLALEARGDALVLALRADARFAEDFAC